MADIRSYLREKEKRENRQKDYTEKIRKHKAVDFYRKVLFVVVVLALAALVYIQYKRHIYTDYDIVASRKRETVSGAIDCRLGNNILTYSKDGVHCTNAKGEVTWNRTYETQDTLLSICGNTVAIADYNGRSIYVQNTEKQLAEISTAMPIRSITTSEAGYVTAVLADTDVAWICTYNLKGEMQYKGQAHMSDAGYPASISLSPDGELLCVSYWYVDAGVMKTNVVIYNLGPVGDNYNDHIVSMYFYTDLLVPYVQFMNNKTAFAVGDGRLMIYSGAHKPVSIGEHMLTEEVQSVYYNDKYIGLVFRSDLGEHLYRLDVYSDDGKKTGSYYLDLEFTDLFFGQDNFVAYNDSECVITTMDGVRKFNGSFTKRVNLMLPTGKAYKYQLVTNDTVDTIQLK